MVRFRIKYRKVGPIRYASHRDLTRAFRRGFAAAQVPVCYSQGFNPHPRLSFGPSLRTGWEGLGECMDVMLECAITDLPARCRGRLPGGLEIVESVEVESSAPKLSADIVAARYEVLVDPVNLRTEHNSHWARYLTETGVVEESGIADAMISDVHEVHEVHEVREANPLDPRVLSALTAEIETHKSHAAEDEPQIQDYEILTKEGCMCVEYLSTMHQGKSVFPEQILEPIMGPALEQVIPWRVVRKEMFVRRNGAYHLPTSKGVVQASL